MLIRYLSLIRVLLITQTDRPPHAHTVLIAHARLITQYLLTLYRVLRHVPVLSLASFPRSPDAPQNPPG